MAQCRIGLLTNYRFRVYLFGRNRLQKELDLPLADLDGEAFQRYLESIATHPLYLLLDLLGEEFRVEQLPHVSGRDRSEVYRRKLQQFFPTASLSQARLQLQEKQGRKDDRVLFTAVGGVAILDHLLSDLARQHIPLAAIYSLPLAMESLLKRVGPQAHTLIVHEIKDDAGNIILFRQSYYQAGKLALSRLNRIGSQSAESHIQDLVDELARTRRYLISSKLLAQRDAADLLSAQQYVSKAVFQRRFWIERRLQADGRVLRGIRPGDRSEGVCARGWDWQDHGTCGCSRAGTGPALQTAACIQ